MASFFLCVFVHTRIPTPSVCPFGLVFAHALLQAADDEGHGHGEDDDAAHHRCQHGYSQPPILRFGNG